MVAPAVVMAYEKREDIGKLLIYLFAFLFLVWLIWKVTGAFQELGEKLEEFGQKAKEVITVSPSDTARVISKNAEKKKATGEAYLIPREIYEGLKESGQRLPDNVKPYDLVIPSPEEKSSVGSWLGLGHLAPKKEEPPIRAISEEEYKELQAKRWEAYARGYPVEKKVKPILEGERHILPVPSPIRDRRFAI